MSIDLGVNAKQFDGDIVVTGISQESNPSTTERVDFSGFVPLYTAVQKWVCRLQV